MRVVRSLAENFGLNHGPPHEPPGDVSYHGACHPRPPLFSTMQRMFASGIWHGVLLNGAGLCLCFKNRYFCGGGISSLGRTRPI